MRNNQIQEFKTNKTDVFAGQELLNNGNFM